MSKLRFAILCRVSTEVQEEKGQSLEVQKHTLTKCIELVGGILVKEYIGQESAMGTKERPIFEELLSDCSNDLFDAVMIYDLTRWSRNPEQLNYGLAILKNNNKRLFVQANEHDLNNPETELFASMLTTMSSYQIKMQIKKSMLSKISLARKGWPLSKHPYGRRPKHNDKSKVCEWEVIPEIQELAEKVWSLYVNSNKGMDKVADELGLKTSHAKNILFSYSGNTWVQSISYEGKKEDIIVEVPPLLTQEQIEKAKYRAKSNKQFNSRKHDYLLGGRIKCGSCGISFVGMSTTTTKRHRHHYVHARGFRTELCIKTIPVDVIETAVLRAISELFSSSKNLKLAIENAIGVSNERKDSLMKRIDELKKYLTKLQTEKNNLVQAVRKGGFEENEIFSEMSKIRENTIDAQAQLKTSINQLQALMVDIPDDLHLRIQKHYKEICGEQGAIADWSYDNKLKLLNWFFGSGKGNGVFIIKEQGSIAFKVVGALGASLLGLVETHSLNTSIFGVEHLDRYIQSTGEVDFKGILQDLEIDTKSLSIQEMAHGSPSSSGS